MKSFSKAKIIRIKIDYYDKCYKYTNKYRGTIYIAAKDYADKNISKCEIKFRYRLIRHIHILTGDITIKDIYKEILSILKMGAILNNNKNKRRVRK